MGCVKILIMKKLVDKILRVIFYIPNLLADATFKVTDGVLGVADISPTWNKAEYHSAKDKLVMAYSSMDNKTKKASLESFIETVNGIDIDSLTIDSSVSFWKYVKSINGNVGYHPLQLL